MNVQLDWQVVNDDGGWESIAQVGAGTHLRLPGWMWRIAAAVAVLLVVGPPIIVRYRYRRALRQVTVQIQDVVDLEARALAQGNVARYLAQQDTSLPDWVVEQAARIGRECPEVGAAVPGLESLSASPAPGVCHLAAPVEIAHVEMREDVAWVEVLQPQAALRQVRFYRQTPQGWLHTAPRVGFWQDPVERTFGRVLVRAHQRDLPYLDPQVTHIVDVVEDVCATLDCPVGAGLKVRFTHHDVPLRLSGTVLTLSSPWLTGIPVDGSRDAESTRALTYWVVYGVASQVVYTDCDALWWPDAFPPGAACKGTLHACATLYSRHGADEQPEVPGVMRAGCSLPGFAAY